MARITVEDCLEHVKNRFDLVLLAAKRARQLERGMSDPTLDEENDKHTVVALREIAAQKVDESIFHQKPEREESDEFTRSPRQPMESSLLTVPPASSSDVKEA